MFRKGLAILVACLFGICSCKGAVDNAPLPAPEFPVGLQWLNVEHPLTMHDLRGKVVLLDFWTFCCINCMHVIPDLHRLETKYGDAIAVVGVHSAKFTTEKDPDNIRQAILRYDVTHPVINDRDFAVWNSYGVSAWPTFVLIDPNGNVVAAHSGEGPYEAFDAKIADLVKTFDAQGKINRTPLPLKLEKDNAPPTPLLFPGKIAADGDRLVVSDSNHNRLVILNRADGSIEQTIGAGTAGLKDGSLADAQFDRPQGVAIDGQTIYVADTENHAIRKVDQAAKTVSTLASRQTDPDISSPWDVLLRDQTLFIAMAGRHQIWAENLTTNKIAAWAGSGIENIDDGPLDQADMAQPSGLATDGAHLFSADSESSSIRAIYFKAGTVATIVGKGLFDYGDIDGAREAVRLQHPLGVAYHDGKLYVADTYNNKIKMLDPNTGECKTLIGTGKAGFTDGPALTAQLNEPGGLAFAGGKMYIADTNNHLIRVYDPASGVVSTLAIADAGKLVPAPKAGPFTGEEVRLAPQPVKPEADKVAVTVHIPDGFTFNVAAPFYIAVGGQEGRTIVNPAFPIQLPLTLASGQSEVEVDLIVYYCQESEQSFCRVKRLKMIAPITVSDQGADVVRVDASVK